MSKSERREEAVVMVVECSGAEPRTKKLPGQPEGGESVEFWDFSALCTSRQSVRVTRRTRFTGGPGGPGQLMNDLVGDSGFEIQCFC